MVRLQYAVHIAGPRFMGGGECGNFKNRTPRAEMMTRSHFHSFGFHRTYREKN